MPRPLRMEALTNVVGRHDFHGDVLDGDLVAWLDRLHIASQLARHLGGGDNGRSLVHDLLHVLGRVVVVVIVGDEEQIGRGRARRQLVRVNVDGRRAFDAEPGMAQPADTLDHRSHSFGTWNLRI